MLTTPPSSGQRLPNSPRNQLYSEIVYKPGRNFRINFGTEVQSGWTIYTDAKVAAGMLDPTIYQNWQKGFALFNARFSWTWNLAGIIGEWSVSIRNLGGADYMAFTEPDPDGNAYHPGPGREIFSSIALKF